MTTRIRRPLAVTTALIAAVGLAACGGDGDSAPLPAETASSATATTGAVDPALAGLVGPGCAAYVAQTPKGAGSVTGMSNTPLATAASKNPLLTTLSKAISGKLNKKVILTQTLDGGEYTVFAPVDSAFAKLPAATTAKLKRDAQFMVTTLTYHVIAGQLTPTKVVGKQTSVQGGVLQVTSSNGALKVNGANVVCGGLKTANATVYLIDAVLTAPR